MKSARIPQRSADARGVTAVERAHRLPLPCSYQKADGLIETARLITTGQLNLEALRTPTTTRAARTLLALRSLSP